MMTSADRCRHNGWEAGDVLQARDGQRIRLTAIGESIVLSVRMYGNNYADYEYETDRTLTKKDWRRIGRWNKKTKKVEVKP
jgi:phage gp45-like